MDRRKQDYAPTGFLLAIQMVTEVRKNMEYKRGSEWRRWEMHMHTPFTKNDYVGDGTNQPKTISAIAITDYLSTDNYFELKQNKHLLPAA